MPRRPAVLLTSPRSIPNSSLLCFFCTLLQKSKAHLLPLQSLPASLQKPRVCRHKRFLTSREAPPAPIPFPVIFCISHHQNEAHLLPFQSSTHSLAETPGCPSAGFLEGLPAEEGHSVRNSHFGTRTRTARLLRSKRGVFASNSCLCHPSRKPARNPFAGPQKHWHIKRSQASASETCALLHRQMFLSLLGFRFCAVQAGVLSQIVQPVHSSRLAEEASREPQETPLCLKKTHGDVPNGRSCGWTRENCFTYMEGHRNCLGKIGTEPEPVSGVDKMFSPSRTRSKWKPKGGVNHEEIQQANAQVFGPPAAAYQV
jgi:hypothetical protein